MKNTYILYICLLVGFLPLAAQAQNNPAEADYYQIVTLPTPEGMLLEVGGLATLDDGRIALCTRRGEVWIVENPDMYEGKPPLFRLYATGLHEPLGIAYRDNSFYIAQRGELTRLQDTNGDGMADVYQTVYDWPVSGHYHEYSYGPKFMPDGSMMVSGNVAFGDEEWWRGESRVPWRGWVINIQAEGTMIPWATGMRSPCGLGIVDGELFYTDNQGDWMGSGGVWHLRKGDFVGHPAGLRWTDMENAPLDLSEKEFYDRVDKRQVKVNGRYVKPDNIADEAQPDLLLEVQKDIPELKLPAVWLPHGILGISNSEIVVDETNGAFGPFAGQLFIGDQGQSKIMRVSLEKVNGVYQGVAFDFRSGFQSGVLRLSWGHDGSLYVGETNRGWGSAGNTNSGLERLVWSGNTPFEILTVRAKSDGFEIVFTEPIDPASAELTSAYLAKSFIYKYHAVYGSPPINEEPLAIRGMYLSENGKTLRLKVDNLRQYYIHQLELRGIRSASGQALVHPTAYYTLNQIPANSSLEATQWQMLKAPQAAKAPKPPVRPAAPNKTSNTAPTDAEIQPLLAANTCIACHQKGKRVVGPSFEDIAKRRYSNERIVQLIYNPEPQNWPDFATPMAPMPQVPREQALQIASWINSLR